jgi:hypothetical protein
VARAGGARDVDARPQGRSGRACRSCSTTFRVAAIVARGSRRCIARGGLQGRRRAGPLGPAEIVLLDRPLLEVSPENHDALHPCVGAEQGNRKPVPPRWPDAAVASAPTAAAARSCGSLCGGQLGRFCVRPDARQRLVLRMPSRRGLSGQGRLGPRSDPACTWLFVGCLSVPARLTGLRRECRSG